MIDVDLKQRKFLLENALAKTNRKKNVLIFVGKMKNIDLFLSILNKNYFDINFTIDRQQQKIIFPNESFIKFVSYFQPKQALGINAYPMIDKCELLSEAPIEFWEIYDQLHAKYNLRKKSQTQEIFS